MVAGDSTAVRGNKIYLLGSSQPKSEFFKVFGLCSAT